MNESVSTDTKIYLKKFVQNLELAGVPEDYGRLKIGVAMSGGVDSSVTAAMFKSLGFQVIGLYMKNWSDPRDCRGADDRADALRVALKLGIPFHVFDFEKEYQDKVIDYFYSEFEAGNTPNPDIMCNKEIKFRVFLAQSLKLGLDYIATGHYASVRKNGDSYQLVAGVDPTKDQTYFLYTFNQEQLSKVLLPLGNFFKSEIREIASNLDLPVKDKPDSQGICFVGEVRVRDFLSRRLPIKKGDIVDLDGKKIGEHDGIYFYTLGQREGIGVGGGLPYYVVGKKAKENILIVAPLNQSESLYSKDLKAKDFSWVGSEPEFPTRAKARIRHLQKLQDCSVNKVGNLVNVTFDQEQRAISPGQSVVLYDNNSVVLGGGVIV